MSLNRLVSFPFCTSTGISPKSHGLLPTNRLARLVPCVAATKISQKTIERRSCNFKPSSFDYDFIQSLNSEYKGEPYATRIEELKAEVKMMLQNATNILDQLEMIDALQRLGVAYYFEDEIERMLKFIFNFHCSQNMNSTGNLHSTALEFRLLRQQGHNPHQDVFNSFIDEQGHFKTCLGGDVKGLLSLYEASYLSKRGENILEEAREFATNSLKKCLDENNDEHYSTMVKHALELPLDWRMPWLEARWYIDIYENSKEMKPIILELAKLNFNMVQAVHQEDLKHSTSWWKHIGLAEKLGKNVRNRPTEVFFWTMGAAFELPCGHCRRVLAKIGSLATMVDDIYDIYGTLEELQLFTQVVERWDLDAMDQLPHYMKICFLALHNSINEMGMDILKDQDLHIIPHLKQMWVELCQAQFKEAKWYHTGCTPTLEEYLENAWISFTGPMLMGHTYYGLTDQITPEGMESIKQNRNINRFSSTIGRLTDDLGTASDELKRGDVPKAMQCYMHDTGVSEEEARKYVHSLACEYWKMLNEEHIENATIPQTYKRIAKNFARMSHCAYDYGGDGFGAQNLRTKKRIISLLTQPISLKKND